MKPVLFLITFGYLHIHSHLTKSSLRGVYSSDFSICGMLYFNLKRPAESQRVIHIKCRYINIYLICTHQCDSSGTVTQPVEPTQRTYTECPYTYGILIFKMIEIYPWGGVSDKDDSRLSVDSDKPFSIRIPGICPQGHRD